MNRFVIRSLSTVGLIGITLPAQADISFVNMFRNDGFVQVGDGNNLTTSGSFFTASLTSENANDFDSATLTYPGAGSPVTLSQTSSSNFSYQTGTLATQADMDAEYPTGDYQFDASGTNGSGSTTFTYSSDDYPQSLPFLTSTDFSDLQGANPNAPINLHFSPFVTGSQAQASFIFLTIFDNTTSTPVFNSGFLSSTATGVSVSANTLQSNHDYTYELIYSNRDLLPSPGAVFNAQIGFDLRTQGHFSTVPAPSALAALLVGAVPGASVLLRRRRKSGV